MAVVSLRKAEIHTPGRGHVRVFPEAASQSYKSGEFVYLVGGKVTACADGADSILGLVMQDASGTTDTGNLVFVPDEDCEFVVNKYHATPASAVTSITDVGAEIGLEVDSNQCYADFGENTDCFIVTALHKGDAVGDRYGRLIVKLLDSVRQLAG